MNDNLPDDPLVRKKQELEIKKLEGDLKVYEKKQTLELKKLELETEKYKDKRDLEIKKLEMESTPRSHRPEIYISLGPLVIATISIILNFKQSSQNDELVGKNQENVAALKKVCPRIHSPHGPCHLTGSSECDRLPPCRCRKGGSANRAAIHHRAYQGRNWI